MADLFMRTEVGFGGAFAADKGLLVDGPNGLTGVLMQNLQLTYQQQVTRVYEIGTYGQQSKMYYVGGRSQGTMNVGHIIGPAVTMGVFYATYGDVCNAQCNNANLKLRANCGGGIGNFITYAMRYLVLTQVGLSVATTDYVINETSQLMFGNMNYVESNASNVPIVPAVTPCGTVPATVLPLAGSSVSVPGTIASVIAGAAAAITGS